MQYKFYLSHEIFITTFHAAICTMKNSRVTEASILPFGLHEITFGLVIFEYGHVESVIA